jgi:hypothetical protein
MGLRAKDIVLSSSAAESLEELQTGSDPSSASIVRRIRALRPILLADCLHGEVVKGDRIPKVLKDRHGLENLFVEDLPSFWRLLYTIVRDRAERYIVIVEIVDHRTYDGCFRRRNR